MAHDVPILQLNGSHFPVNNVAQNVMVCLVAYMTVHTFSDIQPLIYTRKIFPKWQIFRNTTFSRHNVKTMFCRLLFLADLFDLGPVSISDKTSYRKISWSIEAARSAVWIITSHWNLTGSLAVLPTSLTNFRAIGQFWTQISRHRVVMRSGDKTSYRIWKRGPVAHIRHGCFNGTWVIFSEITLKDVCFAVTATNIPVSVK